MASRQTNAVTHLLLFSMYAVANLFLFDVSQILALWCIVNVRNFYSSLFINELRRILWWLIFGFRRFIFGSAFRSTALVSAMCPHLPNLPSAVFSVAKFRSVSTALRSLRLSSCKLLNVSRRTCQRILKAQRKILLDWTLVACSHLKHLNIKPWYPEGPMNMSNMFEAVACRSHISWWTCQSCLLMPIGRAEEVTPAGSCCTAPPGNTIQIRATHRNAQASLFMEVSINGGTPKWLIYNGKPY